MKGVLMHEATRGTWSGVSDTGPDKEDRTREEEEGIMKGTSAGMSRIGLGKEGKGSESARTRADGKGD